MIRPIRKDFRINVIGRIKYVVEIGKYADYIEKENKKLIKKNISLAYDKKELTHVLVKCLRIFNLGTIKGSPIVKSITKVLSK